jgi:peptidoglycan/LPS O-acetylase OafA/YrhL
VNFAVTESDRSTGFYAPELDGLRALAVCAVMIAHFSPTLSRFVDWGPIGVRLFFVLSGFLITQLLLRARAKADARQASKPRELRRFFVRRAFRLWPLYFACLLITYATHVDGTESNIWWHLLFATNQYVFHFQHWPALLSHFWTLAVEQQFYFVWPFAILTLPPAAMPALFSIMLVSGPVTRGLLVGLGISDTDYVYVLLPCCLDFFSFGAIVAWGLQVRSAGPVARCGLLLAAVAGLAGWLLFGSILRTVGHVPRYWVVFDASIQALGFASLLTYLLHCPSSRAAGPLRWPPLVYLGRISYGIYIFHNFMHWVGPSILVRLVGHAYFASEVIQVIYLSACAIAVAALSFHVFEEPVRKFGRHLA